MDKDTTDTELADVEEPKPIEEPEAPEEDEFGAPREIGRVKWFDKRKGYGFIQREGKSDIFIHFTQVRREPQTLHDDEQVEFTPVPGEKGPEAHDVVVTLETKEV